jgi:hypothetical protein
VESRFANGDWPQNIGSMFGEGKQGEGQANRSLSGAEGFSPRIDLWPAERLVLLGLLREVLGVESGAEQPQKSSDLSVSDLMAEIRRHRVGAFLTHRLSRETIAALTPEFGTRLRRLGQQNQMGALRQTAEVIRLTRQFDEAALWVRSIKGIQLAELLYEGQGIRHAGDIDLLIEEKDVLKADALLQKQGFQRTHPNCEMTPLRWEKYIEVWRDCEYRHPETGSAVELMWRLANNDSLQSLAISLQSTEVQLGGYPLKGLAHEVHVVYLLVHGSTHGWHRWFWLVDIALLMNAKSTNWTRVHEIAVEAGVDRHLWLGLFLAQELLGASWPVGLEAAPRSPVLDKNIEDAHWQMGMSPQERNVGASHYRLGAYARRLMPDWTIQRREVSKRWINPSNWMLLPISDRWFGLYYLLWPGLWIWRQLARRFRPDSPERGM